MPRYFFSKEKFQKNKPHLAHYTWPERIDGEEVQFEAGHQIGRTIITGYYVNKNDCIETEG